MISESCNFSLLAGDIPGRKKVKVVLHEIYPDRTHWNRNGITYLEQYTRDNADSVKGMPLCAEFLDDDKEVPYGHGLTGQIRNMPVFEDSVQVGAFEDWSIEDVEIDGKMRRCLCAIGYINESRYPKFVEWLEKQLESGSPVYGSVEFSGTKDNDGEIIYDGGWKEQGRVPMVYDYIGHSIISIAPADDAALMLSFDMARDEFDDVFSEEKVESCTSDFDDIFGTPDAISGTDSWGFSIVGASKKEKDRPLSKREYDLVIAAGLMEDKTDLENFDDIFVIR